MNKLISIFILLLGSFQFLQAQPKPTKAVIQAIKATPAAAPVLQKTDAAIKAAQKGLTEAAVSKGVLQGTASITPLVLPYELNYIPVIPDGISENSDIFDDGENDLSAQGVILKKKYDNLFPASNAPTTGRTQPVEEINLPPSLAETKVSADVPSRRLPLPFEPDYIPENLFDPNDIEFRISPQSKILDKYDEFYKRFEYNFQSQVNISREKAEYIKQAREVLSAPLPPATGAYELIHAYHLPEAMLPQYQQLYSKMSVFNLYLGKKLQPYLNLSAPQWEPSEKRLFDAELTNMSNNIQRLMESMLKLDPALSFVLTKINWAREILFDMPGQLVVSRIPRPKPFNSREYRLVSPLDASPRLAIFNDDFFFSTQKAHQAAAEFCSQIPAGLKIAVLNDNPEHTAQYVSWQNEGLFSNGITVETFPSIGEFLQAHYTQPFGLIITDYFIPGGGGDFLVKILRNRRDATPVILQSYAGKGTSAWDRTSPDSALEQRYLKGYDGDLPGNDDFFSNRGYLYVLEGLRNFYLYHPNAAVR